MLRAVEAGAYASTSQMAQNGTFKPMGNLERGLVFPFWPDELDPEGQAAFCFQTGDIDTWGMKQGPDPVEYGGAGGGEAFRSRPLSG